MFLLVLTVSRQSYREVDNESMDSLDFKKDLRISVTSEAVVLPHL